jgi:DNA helicase-2/ATP-dependent DNA helicase PcrA
MAIKITKQKKQFNEQQLEVINHDYGACVVVAVAGAGKTTAVVERISRMIKNGIAKPEDILATTFTKKAAGEMNERLKSLGVDIEEMQVSTFHSICYKIIREELKNVKAKYELDTTGSKSKALLKYVLGYQCMNWREARISGVEKFIIDCKNSLIRPSEVDIDIYGFLLKQAYELYEKHREERQFITFDDMLIRCWEIFDEHPDIMIKWRSKYKFVIVDEFQDTNKAQYEIMKMLTLPENNIMVVGDDDQSIYSWRGAVPEYMINFEQNFGARVIRMEKNYRCPQVVGRLANPLISNNINRLQKVLSAQKTENGSLKTINSFDFDEEASRVVEYIKSLPEFEQQQFGQIAVLYRTNAQSRAIEDCLIMDNIPYELVGGMNFYQRKEIKDILYYFYAALDSKGRAEDGFERIINVPFRFLSKTFLDSLDGFRKNNRCSFEQALKDIPLTQSQDRSIDEFLNVIDTIRKRKDESPQALITWVVDAIKYYEYLAKQEGDNDGESNRSSNIKELIRASGKFSTIEKFIDYIDMLNVKKKKKQPKNKVILSTIHRAKGLEWDNVIIIGVNELILPHGRNLDPISIEEERRLAYVGVTRTKERLLLSYVQTASVMGGIRDLKPSRFLKEMNILANN